MNTVDIFPWNEHFNTGLITVDKQHKKLVQILNSLASHIAYNSNEDDLNTIFEELTNYTIYHFETEETIWHKYLPNDPLDNDHQAIHQQFVDTIIKLKKEQKTRPLIELAEEALGFLARWLASHILETDRFMAHLIFALRDGLNLDAAKQQAKEKMSGSSRILIDIILSIYGTLSTNTLRLMREIKYHQNLEKVVDTQDRYRDILLELSTDFINLPLNEIDSKINKALEKMAKFVNADRAYIFDYNYELKTTTNTYEWCEEGIIPQINELQNISINSIPGWPETHAKGEYVLIQDLNVLENGPLRDLLFPQKIKSLVTFPLFKNYKCTGFVGFDAVKEKHTFLANEISILEIFSKLLSNIAERRRNESELSHERNFLKTLFKAIPDLVWIKDINGVFLSCNSRFEDFYGEKENNIIGKTDYDFVDKSLADFFLLNDKKVIQSGQININEEKVLFANDGHEEILQTTKVPMYDQNGQIYGVVGVARDITSIKRIQKELEHMAHFDVLTNLPNRVLLSDRLHQSILYTKRHKSSLAIIYLDLDGFKEVNDTYGHSNGDILLKVISNRIQEILRESDTIARLGGDEFAIILEDLKNKEACIPMLKRILSVVSTPIVVSKDIIMQVSASIGVAFFNENSIIDADQLLRQADHAMYQAKLAGKNRFHIFDLKEDTNLRSHNESLDAIEEALNNNEFVMYYQPKVNMNSGEVLGAEALIRWNHPKKGLLSPIAFLSAVESHNLTVNLDSWVIKTVLEQIQEWKKEGINIAVSINISPLKLQENNFINDLLSLLKDYPVVQTSDFTFEILETSALEDMKHVSHIIKECNKIGIDFSLDDFGTGYSSLSYLKNLPAKQLKIDRSFVHDMLDDIDDMAILEGIISLASAFRREVIAEGVESIEQGTMLLRLGCIEAQGYVIAKPMPAKELLEWIKIWKPYPQWKDIKALSGDDIPILYAIAEHKNWINNVISYIKKETSMSPELNSKKCRFGIWLYNQNLKENSKSEAFKRIEELHIEIHNIIKVILNQEINPSEENIKIIIKDIINHRDKFLEEFEKLFF